MKKTKKAIGFVTIMMLLILQISVTAFADTDGEGQGADNAQQTSSAQQSSETETISDNAGEADDTKESSSSEANQPSEESGASTEMTPSSGEATEEETTEEETEAPLSYTEIDLSKGSVLITKDTISQGVDRRWEIFNQEKEIILTGTGQSVTVEGYDGLITLRNATITQSMKLTNNSIVSLKLEGENTIHAAEKSTALEVSRDNTVLITGDGTLTAVGNAGGAGIGGIPNSGSDGSYKKDDRVCGTISIFGGTINATGKDGGAGIGGAGHCDGGIITIGGNANVTANADKGPGIGSGLGSHEQDGDNKRDRDIITEERFGLRMNAR